MKSLLPFLLASLLPCLASLAAAPTSDPNDLANFPRLRGMTVPYRADAKVFHDDAANGANAVRLILSPLSTSASHPAAGWAKMVENLPSQLDAAKEAHLIVIVSLFTPPVDLNFSASAKDEDRKAALHTFWTDPKSLDVRKRPRQSHPRGAFEKPVSFQGKIIAWGAAHSYYGSGGSGPGLCASIRFHLLPNLRLGGA